jgi:Protein of unknown function (DUF2934)
MAFMEKTMAKPAASKKMSSDQLKPEIEKRAKEIFLKRQASRIQGNELSDWLAAEKEIKAKYRLA